MRLTPPGYPARLHVRRCQSPDEAWRLLIIRPEGGIWTDVRLPACRFETGGFDNPAASRLDSSIHPGGM